MSNRSVDKQIEYRAKIRCIAEENPDLNDNAIKTILLGLEDIKLGNIETYTSNSLDQGEGIYNEG